ncbi:MAG: acyltransferase family protein [Cetobacterium sp.]
MKYKESYLDKSQHNTTQHNTTQHRDNYYQGLRGVAILAVLLIHTLGITKNEYLMLIVRQFINYAVPLFLFLAGFFCRKQFELGKFNYKKSLMRILVPYFIWSILLMTRVKFYNFNFKEILLSLIIVKHFGIYYYIILLSQLILLSPVLLKKKFNINILLITPISVVVYYFFRIKGYNIVFPFNVLFIWSGITFYYFGMYFNEISKSFQNLKWRITFFLVFIFNILESIYFFKKVEIFDLSISQFKLSSLALTFFLILFIVKDKKMKNILENKYIVYLGDNSFGIYLIHAVLIMIISKVMGMFFQNSYIIFVITTILTLLLSLVALYLGKMILKQKSKHLGF